MTTTVKITTIGNSSGIILPKDILERLRIDKGDTLYVLETPQGIELTRFDPAFADQMAAAEKVMREDHDALRELAK